MGLGVGPQHICCPEGELQVPRLPSGFPVRLCGVANLVRLSLKAAFVAADWCSVVGNPESARDDKVEGSGPPWDDWRWMDRVASASRALDLLVNLAKSL